MSALPALAATSRLDLCPFWVKGAGDRYTVINREGGHAISTSKAGVEAIRLLSKGRTLERTRQVLGQRYGHPAQEINLEPLLHTLLSAGFVRSLDGGQVASRPAPGQHPLRLWLTLFVLSPLLEMAFRHLPTRLALSLAYRWLAQTPGPELERRILAGLHRAPHLDGTDRGIARVAAGSREALRKQFCDRLLLGSAPPHRLRRWLSQQVRVSGLEHLARARAGGTGVILCSLHLGSYGLIPFVLGARGLPVSVYGGFGDAARADVQAWLAERDLQGDPYPVRLVVGTMGLRALTRCLERGETVLLYCDQAPGEAGGSPGARGWIKVPLLGTRIWSARGLGWLQRSTGAAVLPVALFWEGRSGHHLRLGRQIHATDTREANAADVVVIAAYGALEQYLRQDPAQWLKWAEFDDMIAP